MKISLAIKDLPVDRELDRAAMAALHGGAGDQSNASTNSISQVMNASTLVGNGSDFDGTTVFNVDARHTQTASIFNRQLNRGALVLDHPTLGRLNLMDFLRN